ncbi:MAG: membrane integrity-associated transporter subunit PqiC [Nitrosomonas sp.]|nr:membrane integrity-associated transporter subunit PqiC [Nitrosomonas sp.]MCW5607483.1 membrane integrity-associated transporter subunit PqiC [Nitrosomonas sp.]
MKKSTVILGLLLLTGCTVIPKPDSSTAIYNFAVYAPSPVERPEQHIVKNGKKILIPQITAPSWLDTPAIHYRLAYHNAAQSYTYANSRWSSPPAFLLTQQIKQKIAADTHHLVIKDSSVAIVEYELHIEIEEFSQIFNTLSDSYVSIRFRASLVNNAHRLVAQKIFSTSHATATADAAGAVDSFTIASNRLMNELVEWLNSAVDNF